MSLESLTRLYEHVPGWSGSLPAPAEMEFVWTSSSCSIVPSLRVQPLHRYVREVLHHHAGDSPSYYDKLKWEPIYVVDTNGDLFGYGDGYESARRHENLFEAPMSACVGSPGHRASIAAAEARVAAACSTCRFHGSCDGYPMAEEAARQTRRGRVRCEVARVMLEHVEQRLIGLGMIDPSVSGRRTASSRPWSTL